MEVPDWLMKPTKNNREHIKLLSMIEHVQKAAERRGMDPYLGQQIKRLNDFFWEHSQNTVDLDEGVVGDVRDAMRLNRLRTLVFGSLLTASFLVPWLVFTKTSFLDNKDIACKVFLTKDPVYPGTINVCINGVSTPYMSQNGDVDIDLNFVKTTGEKIQADVNFWIAETIGGKRVDYTGEYNTSRVRIYAGGILVSDDQTKYSSWVKPVVPEDVRLPLWQWVKGMNQEFARTIKPVDEQFTFFFTTVAPVIAGIGSVVLTVYKFLRE